MPATMSKVCAVLDAYSTASMSSPSPSAGVGEGSGRGAVGDPGPSSGSGSRSPRRAAAAAGAAGVNEPVKGYDLTCVRSHCWGAPFEGAGPRVRITKVEVYFRKSYIISLV